MSSATAHKNRGDNRLIVGIVLAVITFWLFAQTTLNVAPTMREELGISESLNNIAVTITALFSGIFIVVAGGIADRLGRLKTSPLLDLHSSGLDSASTLRRRPTRHFQMCQTTRPALRPESTRWRPLWERHLGWRSPQHSSHP